MRIDFRDYMRNRNQVSDIKARRFRMSEQQKTCQAEQLKQRFAKYSGSPSRAAVLKAGWKRFFLILLVLAMGAMLLKRAPKFRRISNPNKLKLHSP